MKTAVLGDLHLGRSLYGIDLTPEIRKVMWQFLEFCLVNKVDEAVQLGDVFDCPTPSEVHRKLFVQWLNEFERAKIMVYVLTGNHDVMGRRGAISALESIRIMRWEYVRIVDRPLFSFGKLFLPFPSPAIYETRQEWLDEVLWVVDSIAWPTTVYSHLNIEEAKLGAQEWVYRGEDFVLPRGVYRERGVQAVLAGHIHKPQRVDNGRIHIVGAAERLRFDEAEEDRIFVLHDDNGERTIVRNPGLMLTTLKLDASGASYGGDPPSTAELIAAARFDASVDGCIVKVVPYIDDTSFVSWSEVESELYRSGARHVVLATPIKVRPLSERRLKRSLKERKLTHEDQAKAFLTSKVQDVRERRAIWKMYEKLKEKVER